MGLTLIRMLFAIVAVLAQAVHFTAVLRNETICKMDENATTDADFTATEIVKAFSRSDRKRIEACKNVQSLVVPESNGRISWRQNEEVLGTIMKKMASAKLKEYKDMVRQVDALLCNIFSGAEKEKTKNVYDDWVGNVARHLKKNIYKKCRLARRSVAPEGETGV